MKALKYQVRIGSDHRVVVDVPQEIPEGMAEVIVLVAERQDAHAGLEALLADFRGRPGGRSQDDIDAALAAERSTWSE